MFRLAYRRFGDHELMVANDAVVAGSSAGIRWYELRDPGGTPTLYQQAPRSGRYRSVDGQHRNGEAGDMLMGYSVSSKKISPAIRFTGRSASDPRNQMGAEQAGVSGSGSQLTPERWGDYASMSIDPTDDCTFWFSNSRTSRRPASSTGAPRSSRSSSTAVRDHRMPLS